ncbi:hypothetical protein ABK040_015657 [Willaertia magna]
MKQNISGHFHGLLNKSKQALNAGLNVLEDAAGTLSDKVRHHASHISNGNALSHLGFGDQEYQSEEGTISGLPVDVPSKIDICGESYKVVKLLDEGGFSFVFLVKNINTGEPYALKRLLIQDQAQEVQAKKEIDVMRKLGKHENVINLIGVSESDTQRGKEIYILMELADDSVVSQMEDRLNNGSKFTEQEILSIFFDTCNAVSLMHSQNPPMIHRDLKVENILRVRDTYKLCDFGSTTTKVYTLQTKQERVEAEEDIQKNTTLAYRAPEMCDLYSGDSINEKADVWALGCVLYKLCYFRGPFEEAESAISIINGKYRIPPTPTYSSGLTDLIKSMLVVSVNDRPTVFEITEKVAKLVGKNVSISRPPPRQQPVQQPPPMRKVPSSPSPKLMNNNNNSNNKSSSSGDLFAQLDWFDNSGGSSSTSNNVVQQQPKKTITPTTTTTFTSPVRKPTPVTNNTNSVKKKQPTVNVDFGSENDAWEADFSDFDNPPTSNNNTTTIKAPTPTSTTPTTTSTPVHKRTVSGTNQGNDLFSQLDWQESSASTSTTNSSNQLIPPSSPVPIKKPELSISTPKQNPQQQQVLNTSHQRTLSGSNSTNSNSPTLSTPTTTQVRSPISTGLQNSEQRRLTVNRVLTSLPRQGRPSQISIVCNDLFVNCGEHLVIEYLVYIRERPIFNEPNPCIKALVLLHHMLQSSILTEKCDPIEVKSLVTDMKETWKPRTSQLAAKFIVEYATWLERRIDIISSKKELLNCNFSCKACPNITEVSELIELLDSLMQLQKNVVGDKSNVVKGGSIIPITSDIIDMYALVTHALCKCSEGNMFSDEVKKVTLRYNQVYTAVSRYFSQVGQFKPQSGVIRTVPNVPSSPPSFFGNQKPNVQPPSNPTVPPVLNPDFFESNEQDEPYTYRTLTVPNANQTITTVDILKKDGNNCCADCSSNQVQWASLNYGVVLCVQCRLAHFTVKTGILASLIMNTKLSKEQLAFLYATGNKTANEYYELGLPPSTKPINNTNQPALQIYVKNKYLNKLYTKLQNHSPTNMISPQKSPNTGLDSLNATQFYDQMHSPNKFQF